MNTQESKAVSLSSLHGISHDADVNLSCLNETLSFLLEVMFCSRHSKLEARIARAMFHESALIVLIPKRRPTHACAMKIDEFLSSSREAVKCSNSWVETIRIQEPHYMDSLDDGIPSLRICSTVMIDPQSGSGLTRNTEVLFVIKVEGAVQRIQSSTVVYDEISQYARSPITLF